MHAKNLNDLGGGSASGMLSDRALWAPDNVALMFEGAQWTFREWDEQATRVAAGLIAVGMKPGDVVASFLTNRPEYLFANYGGNRAGLVGVSCNTGFKGAFLHFPIDHSGATLLITEARLGDAVMTMDPLPASLATIVYLDGVPERVPPGVTALSWDDLLAGGAPGQAFPTVRPSDTVAISFTSGTTGRSKGVLGPSLQGLVMGREAAHAFELTPRDRLYTCMPLFHGMAQVTTGYAAMYAGATMVLSRGFSVTRFWQEIREAEATQASALGSMMHMLMTAPPSAADRAHRVTRVFSAPAPPDVLYKFERRFGVHVIEGYGSTEIKNVLYNPMQGRKIGSMGKPTASSILEIHDDGGHKLPPGQVGEIVYRPRLPDIMLKEYYREPAKTLANMRGLWWRTGDMGWMDEDGFFYFHDRTADRLRRRGENISSAEVEGVLSAFPAVAEAAAVAVQSDVGEDEVMVVLEAAGEPDWRAVFDHCTARLPRFMVPRYYRVLRPLPRTATGKVQKAVLRAQGLTADTWDHVAEGLRIEKQT